LKNILAKYPETDPLIDKAHPQVCPHGDARLFLQLKNQQQKSQLLNKISRIPHPKLKSITRKLGHLIDVCNTIFPSTFTAVLTLPTKKWRFWIAWLSRWGEKFLTVDL